ncbi:hypothetical protein D3C78_1438080 [compost metagenome]
MRLYPVHGEHWLMRLAATLTQPRLVADVVNRVEGGGRKNGIQQELNRHHGHVKLEHQQAGQREAKVKRQQIEQGKEDVKVEADTPKLLIGQGQHKQRPDQIDDKQPAKLCQRHGFSPAASANACCQPST